MAANLGRLGSISYNSATLIGIQTINIEVENTKIEITDNDSSGFREYLTTPGDKSLTFGIDGILKDDVLKAKVMAGTIELADVTINLPDGSTVTGDIIIDSFSNVQTYNEAVTFTASLVTNGAYVYTP